MGTFGVNTSDRAAREMMKAFEEVMRGSTSCQPSQQSAAQSNGDVRLNVDAVETDDAYTYWADVPGLEKSDLKVCYCRCSACTSTCMASTSGWRHTVGMLNAAVVRG